MDLETTQRTITRIDALQAVVRELIGVMTPEQLEKFHKNTQATWAAAEQNIPASLRETISNTKREAYKLSGL